MRRIEDSAALGGLFLPHFASAPARAMHDSFGQQYIELRPASMPAPRPLAHTPAECAQFI